MNPAQLLTHFDRLAEAPDAVPRLRRFILDLAVRGKLVEQDLDDKSVPQLRVRIQAEGKERNNEEFAGIMPDEEPFSRPANWGWVRLGECLKMINGRAFKPADWKTQGLPIVRIQNLNSLNAPFNYCDPGQVDDRHVIDDGCFLISWSGTPGTSFGAFIWGRGRAVLNQHIFKCTQVGGAYHNRFLRLAINGRLDEMIAKAHGGVGLQHITKGKLENLTLPLPPLAEQNRIVAKVDELMALCERLEAAQAERESQRDRLVRASLHRLNQPADAGDGQAFGDNARFTLDHLPRLTTRPEHIPQIRQTILNLAVRGKLVAQDPADEPASELLKRIQATKAHFLKNGKTFAISPLGPDESPYAIPESWIWVRFGDIMFSRDGERIPVSKEERNTRAKNYDYYGASGVIDKIDNFLFDKPLLLIGEDGANLINRSTPIAFIARGKYWVNNHAHVLDGISEGFLRFIELHINAIDLKPYVTGTAQPKMNQAKMNSIPIALPPEPEQRRVVAKVDQLMALCDGLEGQLTTIRTESSGLLEAVLQVALKSGG